MRGATVIHRIWTLISVVVVLSGCAMSEEEYQRHLKEQQKKQTVVQQAPSPSKDDPAMKNIPVRDRTPQKPKVVVNEKVPDQVNAEVSKPKEPTLTEALKDKVLVSPFTMISPISGRWAWVPDASFVMVLTPEGQLQFGPTQGGFYQMISATQLRFQITQVNGVSIAGTAPQDWQVAFFENNTVLLLSKGAQAMPFKRLE
jgi:hypothetical protein